MHFLIPFLLFNLTVSHFCSLHRPVFDSIIRQCDYIINHTAVKANPQFRRANIDVLVKTPVCLWDSIFPDSTGYIQSHSSPIYFTLREIMQLVAVAA